MQYIVSSRGRPIGVTDLGFARIGGPFRSGWFHPNGDGERLMPVIAAVMPAMRAYLDSRERGEDGLPLPPAPLDSVEFADLAEAFHRVGTLDLSLHREDGSLVPTEDIGIRDTEQLLALAREAELDAEADWLADDPEDFLDGDLYDLDDALDDDVADHPELARSVAHDLELLLAEERMDPPEPWRPDDEVESAFPRYQIHVILADEDAIP